MSAQTFGRNLIRWKQRIFLLLLSCLLASEAGGSLSDAKRVQAAVDIYASPVNASCYLAKPDVCKIHVEPFTINLAPGEKLVRFQLVANRAGGNWQVIYDFQPDTSNQPPYGGATTYTPTPVKRDFAAFCGASYNVRLQGQGTVGLFSILGTTNQFNCPKGTYHRLLPSILR